MSKPREMTKLVANIATTTLCIAGSTAAIEKVADPQTETTQEVCKAAGFGTGLVAGWTLSKYTDRAIDYIADKRAARKAAKQETPTEVSE